MRVVISTEIMFTEQERPCLKSISDPVNTTDFPSHETIPFELVDTSSHTFEHTLSLESVPNQASNVDQDTPGSVLEIVESEPENFDNDGAVRCLVSSP